MMSQPTAPSSKDAKQSRRARYSVGRLLAIGLVFYVVFIGSVFDCYFKSPVVHGMRRFSLERGEAKRLVLIVGDGLRADLAFNENPFPKIEGSPKIVAPHLRSIMETRGAFGVSHTRVPTETRPGHVALIGGLYEDPSAVLKGWKFNPVDFDSVFNQSSTTFAFGSPDVIPMFEHGAVPGRILGRCYSAEEEDFTKGNKPSFFHWLYQPNISHVDAVELDKWVLNQLETLFRNATTDGVLWSKLHSGKVIFFLHLLGLDTTGHSYRPHSREYMENIQVVDEIVQRTEELMKEFYGDDETSYIFTADHGMSVIGNHGDGHPDCTRTPLVVWGKGFRGPVPDTIPSSHDEYSQPWGLSHLYRRDIEQADLVALMSTVLGIPWPVNSVGVLPDTDPAKVGFLRLTNGEGSIAEAALVNAKMMLEHYRVKHELKESHALFYKPYPPLESGPQPLKLHETKRVQSLIDSKQFSEARLAASLLVFETLKGLRYLETYDRTLLRTVVCFAYTGWMVYAALYIMRPLDRMTPSNSYGSKKSVVDQIYKPTSNHSPFWFKNMPITIGGICWAMFLYQRSPWTYFVYVIFPAFFWRQFLVQGVPFLLQHVTEAWKTKERRSEIMRSVDKIALYVVVALLALYCYAEGYTTRWIWFAGTVLLPFGWAFTLPEEMKSRWKILSKERGFLAIWHTSCAVCALFPLAPLNQDEHFGFIFLGGLAFVFLGSVMTSSVLKQIESIHGVMAKRKMRRLFVFQIGCILGITATSIHSAFKLRQKYGLPFTSQISNWILFAFPTLVPFIHHDKYHNANSKLLMYFLGFGPCLVVLTNSIEGLFFVIYTVVLICWLRSERMLRFPDGADDRLWDMRMQRKKDPEKQNEYEFQIDDVRIAVTFLFIVHLAFFGIGNVASIAAFYLAPVYRLVTIFRPFLMSALLCFKIMVPHIMLSVILALLNHALHLPPFSVVLVAMTLIDVMTLLFFFRVRDTGSWLEIGESITFFLVTSLLLLWSAGMSFLGEYLMADVFAGPFVMKSFDERNNSKVEERNNGVSAKRKLT